VLFLPLLITLNYYDLLFDLVARISPESSMSVRETISFIGTYVVSLILFMYFCMWLCIEKMPINKGIDLVGGGIVGAAGGIVFCGVAMLIWFAMPFAEEKAPVDEGQMFFPVHKLTMKMTTFVAHRIEGRRKFDGERFMRDLRFGLPQPPTLGAGYYISSVPTGLRCFIEGGASLGGGYPPDPNRFVTQVKERLAHPEMEITPSMQRANFAELRRTPCFRELDTGGAYVAVIMDDVPTEVGRDIADASKMFAFDGEIYYSKDTASDRVFFMKVYYIDRSQGGVATLVSLFQPTDKQNYMKYVAVPSGDDDREAESIWQPVRACFKFDDSQMLTRLMEAGATNEEAKRLIPQLHLGGKAWFVGRGKEGYIAEVTSGDGKFKVEPVKKPEMKEFQKR
jgi:hypothetical protein